MKRLAIAAALLASGLAAAALLVGPERQTDTPVYVGAPSDQREPAFAWAASSNVGLAAWTDERLGQIVVARVDAQNALLDNGGIALGAGNKPTVASDGTDFLVVYERNNYGTQGVDLYAVRVSGAGAVLDTTPIVVSAAVKDQAWPTAAYAGGSYLVAWQDSRAGGTVPDLIFGARVTPAGLVQDPNGFVISQATNGRYYPYVCTGGGNFFVVWSDGRVASQSQVIGARVSPQGLVQDSQGVVISPATTSTYKYFSEPTCAFDGTRFFVAYTQSSGSYSAYLWLTRVETDTTLADPNGLQLYYQSWGAHFPNLACRSGECAVVFNTDDQYSDRIQLFRLDATGAILGDKFTPQYLGASPSGVLSNNLRRPGLAFNGKDFVATWHENRTFQTTGTRGLDIWDRRVDPDGGFADPAAVRLSTGANLQITPSIAFNGTSYLAVWVDDKNDNRDIRGALFDVSGNIVDPAGITVCDATGEQKEPVVTTLGTDFVVAWTDRRSGTSDDIFAARVSPTGQVRDPNGVAVATTSGDQREPRIASDGTNAFIVWTDLRAGSVPDVYGARINASAQVQDPAGLALATGSGYQQSPAIAFDGTNYLLVWEQSGTSYPYYDYIYGSRVSTAGVRLDTTAITISSAGTATAPSVAFANGAFLVAWRGDTGGVSSSRYPPLDGGVSAYLEPPASGAYGYSRIALGSDGTAFLAAWERQPSSSTTIELRARQIDSNGKPLGTAPFVVASSLNNSVASHVTVGVAASGPRQFVAAYDRYFDRPLGNVRVGLKTLSPQPQGSACTGDAECLSGFCVDGFCCDTACGGGATNDCQACGVAAGAKVNGTCAAVAASTTCRPATGVCDKAEACDGTSTACPADAPAPNGTSCDDKNGCTTGDTCQAGACTAGTPVVCVAPDTCHTAGTCNPATGVCSSTVKANGSTCDDANACTRTDTCSSGVCVGSSPVVCSASDQCHAAGVCDAATGVCSNPARPDGTTCSDGNACTRVDACVSGVCTGGSPVVCAAVDACHVAGTCNTSTGLCTSPPAADGTACDDKNACTKTDACVAGSCRGSSPVTCTALDSCHAVGTCNMTTGVCTNPLKPNGATCDDKNACTRTDTCQSGSCVGSNPFVCSATDACHSAGTCDSSTGLCSKPVRPDGTPCNDNNGCTTNDQCTAGVCVGKNPVNCVPPSECLEAATCTTGCTFKNKPDGAACSIGVCKTGKCVVPAGPDAGTAGPDASAGPAPTPTPADAGAPVDAGAESSGCGCASASGFEPLAALALLAMVRRRRR